MLTPVRRVPREAVIMALIVFIASLALYLSTVRSEIGPSIDSTELHIAAMTNGTIHPPGSPQYLVLARIAASVLPGIDAAYRINLFSALCMAGAAALISLITYRLTWHTLISGLAGLAFAAAPRVWYLASIAELYALNSLYMAAVLYLLVAWHQTRRDALYWSATALYAISFGNHTSMILLLPAFLYMVAITKPAILLRPRNLALTALIVLIGAAQYAIIPLRMRDALYCNFCSEMSTAGDFLDYVTGGDFKGSFFDVGRRDMLARMAESMEQFALQFGAWGMALGVIGWWEMTRRHLKLALMLGGSLIIAWVFVMGYNIPDWHDFLMPSYVLFTPLIGYGMARVWDAIKQLRLVQRIAPAVAGAALLVIAVMGAFTFTTIRESTRTDWAGNARALIAAADGEDTLLIMPGTFSAAYYYGYAVPYYTHVDGAARFTSVSPFDLPGLPLGNAPLYADWDEVAPMLEPEALRAAADAGSLPRIFVIDASEPRVAHLGLLPICAEGVIVGYEVIGVRWNTTPFPLIDRGMFDALMPYIVFDGAPAMCLN